jgi:hypothetical protein
MTAIPIFFCERTGNEHFVRGYKCEQGHETERTVRARAGVWPSLKISCGTCGEPAECRSVSTFTEMRRVDTGQTFARAYDLPAGAVYADWDQYGDNDDDNPRNWTNAPDAEGRRYRVFRPGSDGRVLVCVLPDGHHWIIDSRCNNCGSPNDDQHWCWIRHGGPEDGTLHVDKEGLTCSAGAGSIASGQWHGFLHHGQLVQC